MKKEKLIVAFSSNKHLQSSFARYMCGQGFETWVLEVRGAGLSTRASDREEVEKSAHAISEQMESAADKVTDGSKVTDGNKVTDCNKVTGGNKLTDGAISTDQLPTIVQSALEKLEKVAIEEPNGVATTGDESRLVSELTETFTRLSERLSGFLSESQSRIMSAKFFDQISKLLEDSFRYERFSEVRGKLLSLLDTRQNSGVAGQIRDLSQKIVDIIEEGQRSVSPQLFDLQERLLTTVDDFQKQLDLIVKYDWDFDHYLEEDIPAAVR